jgi:uncharacterized hydantoinase/oxoprolinase family protein
MLDLRSLSETDLERLYSSTKSALERLTSGEGEHVGDLRTQLSHMLDDIECEIIERSLELEPA